MHNFFEHKISGGLVTSHKSPEQAFLLQQSLHLKEHQEIKSLFLLKLWVRCFFGLGGFGVFFFFCYLVWVFLFGFLFWWVFYIFNPSRSLYVISSKRTKDFKK